MPNTKEPRLLKVLSFPKPESKPKTTLNPGQQYRIRLLVKERERELASYVEMIARYKALLGDTQEAAPQETPAEKRRPAQEARLISATFAKFQAERLGDANAK